MEESKQINIISTSLAEFGAQRIPEQNCYSIS